MLEEKMFLLHEQELKRKVLHDELLSIIEEVRKDEVAGLRIYAEVHSLNANPASVEKTLS